MMSSPVFEVVQLRQAVLNGTALPTRFPRAPIVPYAIAASELATATSQNVLPGIEALWWNEVEAHWIETIGVGDVGGSFPQSHHHGDELGVELPDAPARDATDHGGYRLACRGHDTVRPIAGRRQVRRRRPRGIASRRRPDGRA